MTLNQDIRAYKNVCLNCETTVGRMFTKKRLTNNSYYRADAVRDASCAPDPQKHSLVVHWVCAGRASSQGQKCCLTDNNPIVLLPDIPSISRLWMCCMLAPTNTRAQLETSPLKYDLSVFVCHYLLLSGAKLPPGGQWKCLED